jgi:hypothetical protein
MNHCDISISRIPIPDQRRLHRRRRRLRRPVAAQQEGRGSTGWCCHQLFCDDCSKIVFLN